MFEAGRSYMVRPDLHRTKHEKVKSNNVPGVVCGIYGVGYVCVLCGMWCVGMCGCGVCVCGVGR